MERRDFLKSFIGLLGATAAGPLLAAQVQPYRAPIKAKPAERQFRAVAKKILDRVASDPKFRKQLLDDPNHALAAAGFEKELQAIQWPATGAAVDCTTTCGYRSCTLTCVTTCSTSCRVASVL